MFVVFIVAFSVSGQTVLKEADACFDNGDYNCALTKFKELIKTLNGREKQIIEIKIKRTEWCKEKINIANKEFSNQNYQLAKENYEFVLQTNSKDTFAVEQVEKCTKLLNPVVTSLSVSKNELSFTSSGESQTVTVKTNASSYAVLSLPSWCSVNQYTGYFTITATANLTSEKRNGFFTVTADDKKLWISVSQSGVEKKAETTLSVSSERMFFSSSGGSQNIQVTTSSNLYTVYLLPAWCSVNKYSGYFTITCSPNPDNKARSDFFRVNEGDKSVKITITQSGTEKMGATKLSTSTQNISFDSKGGNSNVNVTASSGDYIVNFLPTWCTMVKFSDRFVLVCEPNNSNRNRSDWFYVRLNGEEVKINVEQEGLANSSSVSYSNQKPTNQCFNCPKAYYNYGITAGYIQHSFDNLDGFRFGFRIEPLFKLGFGLNTGINFEGYSSNLLDTFNGANKFEQFAINIPLHLEYRLNFSKWFNIFAYGGVGLNVFTNSLFEYNGMPITVEYGGGLRINKVQFNVGRSYYAGELEDIQDFNIYREAFYQNLIVSISLMF